MAIPLNLRGLIATSLGISILMIVYMRMNSKTKHEYSQSTGEVIYLNQELGNLPLRDPGKYRYLQINGYDYPFEIFVGNESGDFKPAFEQIDQLKTGDKISVYYYETDNTYQEGINRFIQFIDKDGVSYFERGDSSKTFAFIVIGLCLLLTCGGIIL